MQAVINGITYDTDTARVLAGWRGLLNPNFKATFDEFVYVTPEGRTFVAGERRGDLSRLLNAQGTGLIRPVPGPDSEILAVMMWNAGALKGSMNANIRDREYNVETAKQVSRVGNDVPRSEVHWLETTLYLTADGYWFVYGEGGPATIYGEDVGGHLADGQFLRPLSPEGARAWLEMRDELDVVREYFPDAQPTPRKSETTAKEVRSILGVELPLPD